MNFIYPILFASFIGFVLRIASRVCMKSLVDIVLTAYITFCGSVILTGFALSEIGKIDDRRFWAFQFLYQLLYSTYNLPNYLVEINVNGLLF
jgi:hypothetical protein